MTVSPLEPAAPSGSGEHQPDAVDLGFARLTPQELRVLVVSAGGSIDLDALADRLSLPRQTVASQRASIREKLGIPRFEGFRDFIARTPRLAFLLEAPTAADGPRRPTPTTTAATDERRTQHLLRVAIDDVEALAARLGANAGAVRGLIELARPEQRPSLVDEVERLEDLADQLRLMATDAIERARRGAPVHPQRSVGGPEVSDPIQVT